MTFAAILHDIGIHEAERKYGSPSPKYQHIEGPPIARRFLEEKGVEDSVVEEVCDIVAHHHWPRKTETLNFKVVYDADQIVGLEEGELRHVKLLTHSGRQLASELGLGDKIVAESSSEKRAS